MGTRIIRQGASYRMVFIPDEVCTLKPTESYSITFKYIDLIPTPVKLSPREKQIAQLVTEGLRSRDIAEKLSISKRTVEVHKLNILRKLHLENNSTDIIRDFIQNNGSNDPT